MITIELTPKEAIEVKEKLPHLASKIHSNYNWQDIKTLEDACGVLGIKPPSEIEDPDIVAYQKLKIIIRAINQGWTPDWNDSNQYKYWPWFVLSSGFGFSYSFYSYDYADTSVGSRLCFESREKSDYTAQQFLDLYKQFLT